jgi:hypothetical protein
LVHLFIIAAAILLSYFGIWNAYFSYDDFWMLGAVHRASSFVDALLSQYGYGIRFALDAVLWTRTQLFGLEAAPYYWISLLQHIVVAGIAYWLICFWTASRQTAFVATLLFATSSTYYEVVTWVTGSNYSLLAIPYLLTLAFWGLYLRDHRPKWLIVMWVAFVIEMLLGELTLSLPLVLLAYCSTLEWNYYSSKARVVRNLLPLLPLIVLFVGYFIVEVLFILHGTSEGARSAHPYGPGVHMLGNLYYLVFLFVPDPNSPPIYNFLTRDLGISISVIEAISWLTKIAAAFGVLMSAYVFWRGSRLVRFAILFVFLTFLPYTLWQGTYAGPPRYRYLPAIGVSILLALFLTKAHTRLSTTTKLRRIYLMTVPMIVTIMVAANLGVTRVWIQQHLANSTFRKTFVTRLAQHFAQVEPGAHLYIEVPAEKFVDLSGACYFVLRQPVHCQTIVSGSRSLEEVISETNGAPLYWLRASSQGIDQLYPPVFQIR